MTALISENLFKFFSVFCLLSGFAVRDRGPSSGLRPIGWHRQKIVELTNIARRCGDATAAAGRDEPALEPS